MIAAAAEERVLRTIALLLGVAGAVFGLLTMPSISAQLAAAPAAWTIAALVATLALPIVLGVLAPIAPPALLRVLSGCVAAGNLAAMGTVSFAFGARSTAAESPWVLQLTALGTTGAALALPVAAIAADVVLTAVLVSADRLATGTPELTLIAVQDGLYALLFCAVFAALAIGSLRAGRRVDAASAAAAEAVTAARDERIRSDERTRVDGLVHDRVLTTLLVAARSETPSPAAAHAAEDALQQLRMLDNPGAAPEAVPVADLLDRLRAQLTALAPAAAYSESGDGFRRELPPRVVEATVGAAAEALRNARHHAGADADIELHVALDAERLEVTVVDDGRGFDPASVPANRLGIVTSIVGRLRSVGGAAEVRSRVGRGTAVRLRWPAP